MVTQGSHPNTVKLFGIKPHFSGQTVWLSDWRRPDVRRAPEGCRSPAMDALRLATSSPPSSACSTLAQRDGYGASVVHTNNLTALGWSPRPQITLTAQRKGANLCAERARSVGFGFRICPFELAPASILVLVDRGR